MRLDDRPTTWDDKLVMFTANLIVEKHPEPMIRSYVSAVRTFLKEDGIQIDNNSVTLSALLKSTKYTTEAASRASLLI